MKSLVARYKEAQRDPSRRQAFAESVNLGKYRKYVKSVECLAEPLIVRGKPAFMGVIPDPLFWIGERRPSRIVVSPVAFDANLTAYDFFSLLVYHEGEHARQNYDEPADLSLEKLEAKLRGEIVEAPETERREGLAYQNQAQNLPEDFERRHSPQFLINLLEGAKKYYPAIRMSV